MQNPRVFEAEAGDPHATLAGLGCHRVCPTEGTHSLRHAERWLGNCRQGPGRAGGEGSGDL